MARDGVSIWNAADPRRWWVSWRKALEYLNALSKGVQCAGYRLRTEAEWEYAAKNAYGLYDMLGNQWEWTWDVEDINTPFEGEMTDPIIGGLAQKDEWKHRRVRGGSFRSSKMEVRAANRNQAAPEGPGGLEFGFRPVRSASGTASK